MMITRKLLAVFVSFLPTTAFVDIWRCALPPVAVIYVVGGELSLWWDRSCYRIRIGISERRTRSGFFSFLFRSRGFFSPRCGGGLFYDYLYITIISFPLYTRLGGLDRAIGWSDMG